MSSAGRWRRQPVVVLAGLAAAGLLLVSTTQPWVLAALPAGPGGSAPELPVTGSAAAAAVPALALVAVAGAVALSLARGPGRVVVALLLVTAGLAVVAAVLALVADPTGPAEVAARRATGVAGVDGARVSGWPLVALLPASAVVVVGAVALTAGRAWGVSARYQAPTARSPGPPTRAALWDALSEGADPTAGLRRDPAE